jgi:actin-like ATPase involved in cell morphogenesis
MNPSAFGLGIDYGTSNTAAILRWPDGRVRPLLFEGSPLLPSAVFAHADGQLLVGSDALHHARFEPARLEPNPKRRIDDSTSLLGDRDVPVVDMIAAALRHVGTEAMRVTGGVLPSVAVAHPAGWGPVRRRILADAARAAGLGDVALVPEPAGAATYFTTSLNHDLPVGASLVVYDLGGGTFDASIVTRRDPGFDVVAIDGIDDIGGLDFDAAVIDWLARNVGTSRPDVWHQLTGDATTQALQLRRTLWEDARIAKEMLSRAPAVLVRLPVGDVDTQFTRDEFEHAVRPLVDRTVRVITDMIRSTHLGPAGVAGLLLVGGSSRIPLVATQLHRAAGVAPIATEQPELIVAEGTLLTIPQVVQEDYVRPVPVSPAPVSPAQVFPTPAVLEPLAADEPRRQEDSRVVPIWTPPARGSVPVRQPFITQPAPPHRVTPTPRDGRRPSRSRARMLISSIALVAALATTIASGIAWAYGDLGKDTDDPRPPQANSATTTPSSAEVTTPSPSPSATQSSQPGNGGANGNGGGNGNGNGGSGNGGGTQSPSTKVKVPPVKGKTVDAAKAAIQQAGLKVTVTGKVTDDGSLVGLVIGSDPGAGSTVERGTTVTLFEGQPDHPPVSADPSESAD